MKYHLSLDGGGSKLNGRLFDDDFNLIASGRGGGVNTTQNAPEVARRSVLDCLSTMPDSVTEIDTVYAVFVGDHDMLNEVLASRFDIGNVKFYGEAEAGLLAGAGRRSGLLAIAGTGADAMNVHGDGNVDVVGAWGPILGDQGGGAWIGLRALRAIVKELNGWGEKTMMTRLVLDKLGIAEQPYDLVHIVHSSRSAYSYIGSFTPLVAQAAEAGDGVALGILREAGQVMAIQMNSLLRRSPAPYEDKVVLCGGAWKSHRVMRDAFAEGLRAEHPELEVGIPWFEHVIAGPMDMALNRGMTPDEAHSVLSEKFSGDIYKVN